MTLTATDPITVESLRGRMLDLDSHLQFGMTDLAPLFGEEVSKLGVARARFGMRPTQRALAGDDLLREVPDTYDESNVWRVKSHLALGANDATDRLRAMDLMGIARQLIFPMVKVAAVAWRNSEDGLATMRHYNDFVLDWSSPSRDRLRPTALLNMHDVAAACTEAERIVAGGCRAVLIPCNEPPARMSPADAGWDPLWSILAEATVPVLFHVGGNAGFLSGRWRPTSLTASELPGNPGEASGPFDLSTTHLSTQTYLSAMVLGGAFERHPHLRVGAIELGAHWVGPMADLLDQRVALFAKRMSTVLKLKPSEYLERQFRVTPGFFEPVATYVDRFGLEDVYAFSTDYPHPEGGTHPVEELLERAGPRGPGFVEKVFVTNGELILPS